MAIRTVNDGYYVDGDTGEAMPVAANTTIITEEEREYYKQKAENYVEMKELALVQREMCGDFYWTLFDSHTEYYPNITNSMLAKIVYLITFMDYDTNILVVRDSPQKPKRPMTKKDVQRIIRLHRCKFSRFWDELLATGVVTETQDGKLRVCSDFCKGKITNKHSSAMKIFIHAVRYMYENIDVRSHQYIAYLFRLIPYINLRYNVFCKNPLETDRSKLELMTAKDMCHLFGIDETNLRRFIKTLFKLSFMDKQGNMRSVIKVLTDYKNYGERNFVLINPQFYSAYICQEDMLTAIEDLELVIDLANSEITAP